ncbi:RING-HC finger protein [archaeon]|nr:MAG: RING-HC finger protein [archaeon]
MQATSDSVPSREEYVLKFGHDKTSKHNSGAHEESTDKNGGDIEMCTIASAGDEEAVEAHSPNHGEQPLTLLLESSPSNSAFPTLTSVERCVVCFSRAVSVIFQECGHAATCLSCAVAIARSSNQDPQCPLCRQAFTCMFDMPLGNRFTYQHSDLSPSQPTTNALIESSAKSLPIEASTADYEVIRSDWLYSFAKPGSLPGASNAGNEASLVAADMNNAQAIGNTVNALAAINTVSNHFSLIDILL